MGAGEGVFGVVEQTHHDPFLNSLKKIAFQKMIFELCGNVCM